ncbi:MAG: DUF3301 domain-containing protein [Pseudomonadota bacterium]
MNSWTSTLPAILMLATACLWWYSAVQARDQARALARLFCQRQGWQLLDQTVALEHMRPKRLDERWQLQRRYRFEYSPDGGARRAGGLLMSGNRPLRIWADAPDGAVFEEVSHH